VSSNQALNGIVLEASDSLAVGTQTANITSSTGIILTQGNQVDGATQALNLIDAHDIGSGGIVSQTVNQLGAGTTTLTQADNAATGGNMQAANLGIASGDVIDLDQVYAEDGDLTLVQSSVASSSNIQGVNYVEAADHIGATGLDQSVTVDGTTSLTQGELNVGGLNVQVGNGAVAIAGTISKTSQAFTSAGDMGLTQSAGGIGGNNIQAVNMISAEGAGADIGDAAAVTQTVTVGAANLVLTQDAASNGNIQAGNLALSGFNIANLDQTITASGATTVDFNQTPTGTGNTQAGNMIKVTGSTSGLVDEATQVFTSSGTSTDFNQSSVSSTLIQAGNLIDLGAGNSINDTGSTQSFTAGGGSVAMTQDGGGSSNLQALNGIVYDTTGAVSVFSQEIIIPANSFTMSQDGVTGSGQYGNFVGAKYN
jgi:hypothetical protein